MLPPAATAESRYPPGRGGAPSLIVVTTLLVVGSTLETEPARVFGTQTAAESTAGTPAPGPTWTLAVV